MAEWKYTLKIKQFFMSDTPIPIGEVAGRSKKVADSIRFLFKRVMKSDSDLGQDLEDFSEEFEDLSEYTLTEEDRELYEEEFNEVMGRLYDLCDQYRIWVQ